MFVRNTSDFASTKVAEKTLPHLFSRDVPCWPDSARGGNHMAENGVGSNNGPFTGKRWDFTRRSGPEAHPARGFDTKVPLSNKA